MPVSSSFDDLSASGKGTLASGSSSPSAPASPSRTASGAMQSQLPAHIQAFEPGDWTLSGCGVFSWSVFRLYRACLYVRGSLESGQPYALVLSYLRKVTAQQIADTSVQQFERLGFGTPEQRTQWGSVLLQLLPDVTLGDQLTGLFYPDQKVVFFDGTRRLGVVEDAEFARAFAAIWLDPRTQGQALRKALLGLDGAA